MPESKEREGIQFIDSSRPPPARDNLPSTALVRSAGAVTLRKKTRLRAKHRRGCVLLIVRTDRGLGSPLVP